MRQLLFVVFCLAVQAGCKRVEIEVGRAAQLGVPSDTVVKLKQLRPVEDFDHELAQFETVFWDLDDTTSLRALIRKRSLAGKRVLEIGTGTGLISLCCAKAGAAQIVATDINPSAIANADYNSELLGYQSQIELRFVSENDPLAYSVVADGERFDLIISNPPWEDGKAEKFADYAYYDRDFRLLDSLLLGLRDHLNPGGKAWLAYGCLEAIRTAHQLAEKYQYEVTILDDRQLDELDELFLPGMLLEVVPK